MKAGWEKWGQQRQAAQLIADSLGQGVKKSLVNKYLKKLGLRGQGKQTRTPGMVRSLRFRIKTFASGDSVCVKFQAQQALQPRVCGQCNPRLCVYMSCNEVSDASIGDCQACSLKGIIGSIMQAS